MRMIPASPSSRASNAERKVFYALKSIPRPESTICLHSLGLPSHAYKACCELDFVISGPDGLFALEVKGGGVSRNEQGVWEMTDRTGAVHRHNEGPFKQVEGNFFALQNQLKKSIPSNELHSIPKGWGVVFPDCRFDIAAVEWDDATVADQHWMSQFSNWFNNMVRYYQKKSGVSAAYAMNPALLRRLTALLRPPFEKPPSIAGALDTAEMTLRTLTDEQCRVVDILAANSSVLCRGGAGTGKTYVAVELARRSLAEGRSVMLCCASPWLRSYLDATVKHPNLKVLTVGHVHRNLERQSKVDVLIVDEAQDMMNMQDLDDLDQCLEGGLAGGAWSFFMDSNNQAGLIGDWDPRALELLESFNATHVPLTQNCRNTRPIVKEIVRRTGCDMGLANQGEGPDVEIVNASSAEALERKLEDVVAKLLGEGVSPGHITILSPLQWSESSVSRMSEHFVRRIVRLDEYSMRDFPPNRINFSRIHDFKGLENTAVICVDIDKTMLHQVPPSLLYVGMSRARAYLVLLLSDAD